MNDDGPDYAIAPEVLAEFNDPEYTQAQLDDLRRQKPFHEEMDKVLRDLGYAEAVRNRDTDRRMEIAKIYVDKWLKFDPIYPGLHNYFQAAYWINRLTGGLVRHKRFEEAKFYLDIYFGRNWDRLHFSDHRTENETMRKRHQRITKIVAITNDAKQVLSAR